MTTIYVFAVLSALFVVVFTLYAAIYASHGGGQSPQDAIVEVWKNIIIGFSVNFVANMVILPQVPSMGYPDISFVDNFAIGWIYTAISIVRSYVIRRLHNRKLIGG